MILTEMNLIESLCKQTVETHLQKLLGSQHTLTKLKEKHRKHVICRCLMSFWVLIHFNIQEWPNASLFLPDWFYSMSGMRTSLQKQSEFEHFSVWRMTCRDFQSKSDWSAQIRDIMLDYHKNISIMVNTEIMIFSNDYAVTL